MSNRYPRIVARRLKGRVFVVAWSPHEGQVFDADNGIAFDRRDLQRILAGGYYREVEHDPLLIQEFKTFVNILGDRISFDS